MEGEFARLRGQKYTKVLSRDQLESRITHFLEAVNVCVLSTSQVDVPRSTPIEYYSQGTTLYMVTGTTPSTKIANIRANPRVSIGVYSTPYTDWTNWDKVAGAQITGVATVLTKGDPGYDETLQIYQWQHYARARGWDQTTPPPGQVYIKVEPSKIEYLELALMQEGYTPNQVWEAP